MPLIKGIILGIIQGITEFLPISSTGHLVLAQSLLKIKEPPVILDSILHLGTLLAVIVFFRSDLVLIIKSIFKWSDRNEKYATYRRMAGYLLIGSIPAAVLGIGLRQVFENEFKSIPAVGIMLLVTGVMLWLAESFNKNQRDISTLKLSDSIWVGIAQSLAIMPGLSRSGTTITAGLWRGLDRTTAARFSFLLSIPAILGASVMSILNARGSANVNLGTIFFSTGIAFVTGLMAIAVLIYFLEKHHLRIFSVYCFIVGTLTLAIYYL